MLSRFVSVGLFLSVLAALAPAPPKKHILVYSPEGVPGYKDTPKQPWSGYLVHDPDRPVPPRVDPGEPACGNNAGKPPSDAIVLFDGRDMKQWLPAQWSIEQGCLVAGRGDLTTRQEFGHCQLHLEWQAPDPPQGSWSNRGNNGVKMLGLFEIQIFDSDSTKIYADGQAAAVYSQTPPLVNACRKSGQWQTYDIALRAPRFQDGKLVEPARLTMFHNGVLVHFNQEIYGSSPHAGVATYDGAKATGPISLLAHNSPVKFRSIWIRPLR